MSPEDRRAEAPAAPPAPPEGSVADLFKKALPGIEMQAIQGVNDVILVVDARDAHRVLEAAKHDEAMAFDFLRDLTGVDYEADGFEVVYQLRSFKLGHCVTVRAKLPRENPALPSVTDLWRGADWHERETRDMFGINFEGHPNLVPLLLPDDMLDHFPLRKDVPLAPLEEWQGEQLGENMAQAGHIPPGSGFNVEAAKEGE
ncbi:MAG TPA: NADH-quinone oxidoreductase subunit C [Dehalococcoidia bacterium]|jgi:NADH-quinone oxidoreductase subunit C|nr:NADH-quinone oxidoreductase subunit C [Dehalococcoidia bacterium]